MTPDGRSQLGKLSIISSRKQSGKYSEILTPSGTKPFIQAFCPTTQLMENYPAKHLSMQTVFQRGDINDTQISQLNQNAMITLSNNIEG